MVLIVNRGDYKGPFTATLNVAHRMAIPVRQFGRKTKREIKRLKTKAIIAAWLPVHFVEGKTRLHRFFMSIVPDHGPQATPLLSRRSICGTHCSKNMAQTFP
jgi:hypothetical protein